MVSTTTTEHSSIGIDAPVARGGASLIVAWSIAGRDVLVIGGNDAAAQRVFFALEADAHVHLVAPETTLSPSLRTRIARREITWLDREAQPRDLEGKALVLLTESTATSKEIIYQSKQRRIPINVADSPEVSDFWFTSTYRDHGLQVALSTSGNEPAIARKLRKQVANALPTNAGLAIQRVSALRQSLRDVDPTALKRRSRFVARLTEKLSLDRLADLTSQDIDRITAAYQRGEEHVHLEGPQSVTVHYVHAAHGNPELLTVQSFKAIASAGLVIADADVDQQILDVASHFVVLDETLKPADREQELHRVAAEAAKLGLAIVRVTGADAENEDPEIIKLELALFKKLGRSVKILPSIYDDSFSVPKKPIENHLSVSAPLSSVALPPSSHTGLAQSVSGQTAAAHVAYALSDLSFIYSVSSEAYIGQDLELWSEEGRVNALGQQHKVLKMSTRSGAASAVHGAIAAGQSVSAVLSSEALPLMIPAMYQISHSKSSVVFHVASRKLHSDFSVTPDFSDVMAAAFTGFALLGSQTVQEAHDLAIISHVAARVASTPVLHFFDGARIAHEVAKISVLPFEQLAETVKTNLPPRPDVVSAVDLVMEQLEPILHRRYRLFEYTGAADAEVVVVALGSAVELARQAALHLNGQGEKVGVLGIRLLRPWSAQHFINALPPSTKKVLIVDQSSTGSSGHGQLFLDVSACFYSSHWSGSAPVLVKAAFSNNPDAFHPVALEHAFRKAQSSQPIFTYTIGSEHVSTEEELSYVDNHVHQAILWDIQESQTALVGAELATDLEAFADANVQSYVAHDDAQIDPVSVHQLRYGPGNTVSKSFLVHSADYAAVHDITLLEQFNVARTVTRNGVIVLNTSLTGDALIAEIPEATRNDIIARNISLKTVDANGIAKDFTSFKGSYTEYVKLILKGIFFKLAPGIKYSAAIKHLGEQVIATESDPSKVATKLGAIKRGVDSLITADIVSGAADSASLPAHVGGTVSFGKLQLVEEEDEEPKSRVAKSHEAILPVLFSEAYGLVEQLRPDLEDAYQVKVTENRRVTPDAYDRNVFHMEMDITGTGLKYAIGEALGVHGHNDIKEVEKFLDFYGVSASQVVKVDRRTASGERVTEGRTVGQLLTQVHDLFGKPGRKFYQDMLGYTKDLDQHGLIYDLLLDAEAMETFINEETPTYADLLERFPACHPPIEDLLNLIPHIKPRHYSISSAQSVHPNSVHLLVVLVDWKTKTGKSRYGHCTRYLANAAIGQTLTVTIKPSVMKLPPSLEQPVIMAGLGTGMAPFRAFIEERAHWKSLGHKVGPMVLYFGSRYRGKEYLYGEEMEAYHADGVLTHLRLAFSRDQKEKIYIQHKIQEDRELLGRLMLQDKGAFYLCGPTWPVPDVRDALVSAFEGTNMEKVHAIEHLETLKDEERYILEVY
ncbi:hypothetical protein DFS34DRAFT_714173 [Phlyctochytrium arcticum]|nr:hypothetical protein DFS34DRAFT_714173 [Phlyctochytrium arcticum]